MTNPNERPRELSESSIVRAVADAAAERLAKRAIKQLQQMRHTLSGDDSELKTVWDEICAQAQGEESYFWDAYEDSMQSAVASLLDQLPMHEREAIWLQSDEGWEWQSRQEAGDARSNASVYPMCDDDVAKYVAQEHVMRHAGRWSNPRIRAFLDRANERD
jgi:hypothetical protein